MPEKIGRARRVNHSEKEWVNGDVHTNTVESAWSLLDRGIMGSYHKLSVKHLPRYLDEFASNMEARGTKIHWASTGQQAREIILGIVREKGAKVVVKSKAMTAEEIHLNEALERAGGLAGCLRGCSRAPHSAPGRSAAAQR